MATKKKSKASARNALASRGNNNKSTRAARNWTLGGGANVRAALEAAVAATVDGGVRLQYSPSALLTDAREMLESQDEDLRAFAAEKMPVTKKHLELLAAFVAALEESGVGKRLLRGRTEVVSEDAQVAMAAVVSARNKLALRASANGIPLSHFDIRRSLGSPRSLYNAGRLVVATAKQLQKDFDNPTVAGQLITALDKAVDALGDVAGLRLETALDRAKSNKRQRQLVKCLYEYMLWLSGWGRAMAGDDPETNRRWRLDKTFPSQPDAGEKLPDDVVASPVDPDAIEG